MSIGRNLRPPRFPPLSPAYHGEYGTKEAEKGDFQVKADIPDMSIRGDTKVQDGNVAQQRHDAGEQCKHQ